jgi:hypothetical protein
MRNNCPKLLPGIVAQLYPEFGENHEVHEDTKEVTKGGFEI